ncbi:MAG: lysophospholipid acyltransferase family protein [Tannerellaceae bacterium]|jgi:predicted LPLAT superfamily acyltransferase|nr:lysophospholipid acyltransferase family protein [Tannerellaceae bacterium]
MTEARKWKGRTGGSTLGQQGLIVFFKCLHLRAGYFILAAVVPFYLIFSHKNCRAIYRFFRKRLGATPRQSFIGTCKNHYRFGQIILDRFVIFARGKSPFELEVIGGEYFDRLIRREKGFLIAGSHTGNFEIGGYLLHQEKKKIHALVYAGETETVRKNRTKVLKNNHIDLVPVLDDMSHLFTVHAALQRGDVVSMPCDRNLGSSKCVTCRFLNGEADFPAGAFSLADTLGVEILALFVMKESGRKYTVYVKPVQTKAPEAGCTRQERIAASVRSFAGELEAVVRRYPEQWFNYYEFWKDK